MNNTRQVFPERGHPYYILAPRYDPANAEILALHLLCDAINRHGNRAYLIVTASTNSGAMTDTDLLTPLLDQTALIRDLQQLMTPIVVYPGSIKGNPFQSNAAVRWVQTARDLIDDAGSPGVLVFGSTQYLAQQAGVPDRVLRLPVADPRIFRPDPVQIRRGCCFYVGNYRLVHDGVPLEVPPGSLEVSLDCALADTAALFRRSELFYCFENSWLAFAAVLCGCPTVFIPSPVFGVLTGPNELGWDGFAWGVNPEEIERAKTTVQLGREHLLTLYDEFWPQFDSFIEQTQARAKNLPYRLKPDDFFR